MSSKAQQGAPPSRTGGKRPQVTIQLNATPSAPGDDAGGESGYYVPGTGADVSTAEFSKIVAAQLVGAGGGSGEELPALAGGGAAVGGGGGGGANEAAAAAALPNLDYGVLEDVVHATVWDVGRLVGFQVRRCVQMHAWQQARVAAAAYLRAAHRRHCYLIVVAADDSFPNRSLLLPADASLGCSLCAAAWQAFNVNPSTRGAALQEHVPATIFVASDHLCRLLVRDMWLRDRYAAVGGGVTSRETRFAHVVHQLHASIFRPYATRWCRLVGLKPRPTRFDEVK